MKLTQVLEALEAGHFYGEDREQVVQSSRRLLRKLQKPSDFIWEIAVETPLLNATIKTCLDLGIFEKWSAVGHESMTRHELSELVGKDPDTIRRLLRHLAANGVVLEVTGAEETYVQTPLSEALCGKQLCAGISYHYEVCGGLYLKLPEYLRGANYELPRDPRNGFFQEYKGCKGETLFEYYSHPDNKEEGDTFNDFLAAYRTNRIQWVDMYHTNHIIEGYTAGPLLVDIGGNLGKDLDEFRSRHPGYEDELFLQDIPNIVSKASCHPRIQRMPHDFFKTQPVKDARAYYLHSILHDWNNSDALEIIRNIASAMKPGYSKLLVNDIMLPPCRPSRLATAVDMQVMIMVAGRERTEDMFRGLLEMAGLKVVQVWRHPSSVTSIIESIVPDVAP